MELQRGDSDDAKESECDICKMRKLFPKSRIVSPKSMLFIIEEEDEDCSVTKELFTDPHVYKSVFKRVHKDILAMTIDRKKHKGRVFMSTSILTKLIHDLINIKSGKYTFILPGSPNKM